MQWCVQMLMEQLDFRSSWETLAQHHLLGGFWLIKIFCQLLVLLQVPGFCWSWIPPVTNSNFLPSRATTEDFQFSKFSATAKESWEGAVPSHKVDLSPGAGGRSRAGASSSWNLLPIWKVGQRCPLLTSHEDVNPAESWKGWVSLYSYKSSFG